MSQFVLVQASTPAPAPKFGSVMMALSWLGSSIAYAYGNWLLAKFHEKGMMGAWKGPRGLLASVLLPRVTVVVPSVLSIW